MRVEDRFRSRSGALESEGEWTRERIAAAMHGADSQSVRLTRPIQVILFYLTAVVVPEDGSVHFAKDVYGHDLRLHRALGGEAR